MLSQYLLSDPPVAGNRSRRLSKAVRIGSLVCIAALTGCTSQPEARCSAIEKLARRDAVADARVALAKGDRRLLMLGGFAGSVPGVENADGYEKEMMEGTSDLRTAVCARQRGTADTYAAKYNQAIVQKTRRGGSSPAR